MKLLVNFILAFIFINLVYSDKCKSDNFDILWRLVDIEEWKSGKIVDVHINNPRIIEMDRTVNEAAKKNICKNTFIGLDNLYILRLNSSGIEQIEGKSFETNKRLYHIDLTGNDLKEIAADVFEGTNLRILHLGQNKIKHIASTAFNNMAKLEILDLSYNMIETLSSEWFKNTNKVIYLLLNNNKITSLDAKVFKNLKHSNVDDNKPLNIHLENNTIEHVDKNAFDGVERLGNLHLDYNGISILDGNTFLSLHIDNLYLDSNSLTCVDGSFFEKTSKTYLDDNLFTCNCLYDLKRWSKENGNKLSLPYRTTICVKREFLE
ncbi:ig(immunoglobulin) and lrr(leucine rich repeat) domain [Holotrichia oblita]|uniref:Ig(Immunoglobulin) and lrr(Leucine rich repeat) domain n=1 Tax=Holotrichia oblita TaxID=644536 RepID=A0ACB9TD90_HOLOL|nr:ig(immunoglobulin) and lrr(leucine rich repeat) domain [Holotrichia oblita]